MSTIKLGFIGLGRMGITHLSILNSNPLVEVTSASDPSKVMKVFFNKYFKSINLYDDYKELIERENPGAIIISTPPNLHYEIINYAIEKGTHIFCEKPFTLSSIQSSELADLVEKKEIVNQVGYVNRFNDMFIKAKELIDNNVIGKIIRFKSEMFSFTISKEDEGEGWRGNEESGGGCLNEMGSHAIDLVNYLVGVPNSVSGSVLNKVYSKNVDDIVSTTFNYQSGIAGTLYVNWCDPSYRKPSNKLEIFGKDGKILVDQHDLKIFLKEPNEKYNLKKGWNTIYITDTFQNVPFYVRGKEFTSQLYHFIDCVKSNTPKSLCTFRDAAQTQKVLKMIRDDFRQGGGDYGKN
jgi:predicted dehydrogenase